MEENENTVRAVLASFQELERREFVTIKPGDKGAPNEVFLLREDGTGSPYAIPHEKGDQFFRVPEALWTTGMIASMDGPALAVYLVLLSQHRADRDGMWFSPALFKEKFSLSDKTRQKGLNSLVNLGVVSMEERYLDLSGERFGLTRRRRIYTLDGAFAPHGSAPRGGHTEQPEERIVRPN